MAITHILLQFGDIGDVRVLRTGSLVSVMEVRCRNNRELFAILMPINTSCSELWKTQIQILEAVPKTVWKKFTEKETPAMLGHKLANQEEKLSFISGSLMANKFL